MAVDDDGLPRRFVPGHGWVDWPLYVDYLCGEVGAYVITEDEARRLMAEGIGWLSDDDARGDAATIPV